MRIALDHLDARKREIADTLNQRRDELKKTSETSERLRAQIADDEERLAQLTRASQILMDASAQPSPPASQPPAQNDAGKVGKKQGMSAK